MKWISFFVLLVITASPSVGRTRYYLSHSTGIRYSPYAFGINHSGLIPSRISHSPYAFGIDHSGLISDYVAYTPYAFGVRHNGLVSRVGVHHLSPLHWNEESRRGRSRIVGPPRSQAQADRPTPYRRVSYGRSPQRRPGRGSRLASRVDQRTIAYKCLDKLVPGQYKITRLLRIGGETVSFDVQLKEMGCVIKYWNQSKIDAIKQNAGGDKDAYTRYLKSWARVANEYELEGGEVRHLVSYDDQKIPEKLAGLLPVRVAKSVN